MDKKALKDLLELCRASEFRKVFSAIQENPGKVDNKCAIALVVGCCNCCVAHMSSPEEISEDDLVVLIQFLKPFFRDLTESELLSYLQSIFFIIKLLVKKKCYNLIAKLEDVILPTFLPTRLEKKHKDTYQSCASLLHNLVTKSGSERCLKQDESLLRISYIVSRMYNKVGNVSGLFSVAYNCTISLLNVETGIQDLEQYFFHIISLVETREKEIYPEEAFKPFLSNFMLIFNKYLKKFEFKKCKQFYEKVLFSASRTFDMDFVDVLTLLKLPLILTPSNFSLEDMKKCKTSLERLSRSPARKFFENKLNSLLYNVIFSYYKTVKSTEWGKVPENSQMEVFQLIDDIGECELQFEFSCPCTCSTDRNVYGAFSYAQYICALVELSVKSGGKLSPYYHETASKLLEKACEKIVLLKASNCEKWVTAWNTLGVSLYNISVHLYQKTNESCLNYFRLLIRYFIKFEVKNDNKVLKHSMISSSFTAVSALSTKDYKKCMAFTALAIFLCPNQNETLMSTWIKTKVGLRDLKTPESDEIQTITLVSAFKKFETELRSLTDNVDLLNTKDKVNLLTVELEQYKKRWKSKVPMMMALKELCDIADVQTSVKVIVKIFSDADFNLHDDVPIILHKILKLYEKKTSKKGDDPQSTIHLAILYFLHYKYRVKDTISKNADEMEKSMLCTPQSSDPPDAIPRDPTEECDIVSSYESLRLDKYTCVMKYLNKSLTLFTTVSERDFNPDSVKSVSTTMLYNLLMKISFEYRLHCHRLKTLQSLQIALKLAQLKNDTCRIVECSGFLIEHSDVTKSYVKDLISLADKFVGDVRELKPSIALTYYICKAKAYLYHDYKEAYRIFEAANQLYEAQEDKEQMELVKCQLLMLHFKFVLMPCSYQIVDHRKSTLFTIHSANSIIFDAYNKSRIAGAYEMSVLLEANEELARLYHNLRSPREVRAYCRETIILAQKLVLPLRCASYLVYLAHADLKSTRYEDCQVKLDGLADILGLVKHSVPVEEKIDMPSVGIQKEVEAITNDMQEMVLDLPIPNHYKRQFSPSSPVLVLEPFYLPAFVKHGQSCDCFCCVCFEYQALVLEKIRLEGLINVKQGNEKVAKDFFVGGMELYECYMKRYSGYRDTVSKLVLLDLVPGFEREFLLAYGSTLLNYSYHLMRSKNKTEALNVTNKLLELVMPMKVELGYMYSEALVQKLGYLTDIPDIVVSKEVDMEVDNAVQPIEVPKTPESKHSKVTLPVNNFVPTFSPPKRITKKCLKFNLSPDGESSEESEPKKASPVAKRVPKTPAPKIQPQSNEDLKAKTPAPAIQIFVDRKSTRKKNPASDRTFLAPSSVDSGTPTVSAPSASGSVLKSKTRLLTERLKQSTKKSEAAGDGGATSEGVKSERKVPSVRKNLLNELGGGDGVQSVGRGAVKRSTRQRKP